MFLGKLFDLSVSLSITLDYYQYVPHEIFLEIHSESMQCANRSTWHIVKYSINAIMIMILITIIVIFITKETCQKYILSSVTTLLLLKKQLKVHFLLGVGSEILS